MKKSEQIKIPTGTEFKISTKGYYEYWYPSEETDTLKYDILVEEIDRSALKFHLNAKWVPYKVSREVADLCGSPIQVLWIEKGN